MFHVKHHKRLFDKSHIKNREEGSANVSRETLADVIKKMRLNASKNVNHKVIDMFHVKHDLALEESYNR